MWEKWNFFSTFFLHFFTFIHITLILNIFSTKPPLFQWNPVEDQWRISGESVETEWRKKGVFFPSRFLKTQPCHHTVGHRLGGRDAACGDLQPPRKDFLWAVAPHHPSHRQPRRMACRWLYGTHTDPWRYGDEETDCETVAVGFEKV